VIMAEAYWDLESRLIDLGIDACYDKRLYDRLASGDVEGIRAHLQASPAYQARLVRFTENHDEPRATTAFGPTVARAAAIVIATVPGITLWHEGQAEGYRIRLPVLLGRRPPEATEDDLATFHHRLWASAPTIRRGEWALASTSGWPDNDSHRRLLAWTWADGDGLNSAVVVNYSGERATARVHVLPSGGTFTDVLTGEQFERDPAEIADQGLFVELGPWTAHVLVAQRARQAQMTSGT
ncbi:MAG: alpha-amylase, partial [Acidimicrobiales bacterium]